MALVELQSSLPQPTVQDPFDILFLVFQGDDLADYCYFNYSYTR